MQKLEKSGYPGIFRTSWALSPVTGDERPVRQGFPARLKALKGRGGATGTTSSSNDPDAALTATGQAGQDSRVPAVYVLSKRGEPLMPTSPRKARVLLLDGRAKVYRRTPFTIRLLQATGETIQPVILGVDSGYGNIGLSAVTNSRELYAAEIALRSDLVNLNSERRQYRRSRRNRKTWYRQPRFDNRKKDEGWLAPSIQNKLEAHEKVIDRACSILPVDRIVVEVASFDIQKIKNPEIEGVGYQQGEQLGAWNVREYVLHRDGHTCQVCRGRSKDPVLETHHITSRKTGGDRPANLVTLCSTCHGKVSRGEIHPTFRIGNGFKAETFMTMVRWVLVNRLREKGFHVSHTYGYITKSRRIEHGIPKSHINDAFVIGGGTTQARASERLISRQVRKSNRKLHKGDRSHIRNTAPRLVKGFQRFDKVLYHRDECFVFGRRSSGYFDLRRMDGTKVHASAKAADCKKLESAQTIITQRRKAIPPHPARTGEDGVSSPNI